MRIASKIISRLEMHLNAGALAATIRFLIGPVGRKFACEIHPNLDALRAAANARDCVACFVPGPSSGRHAGKLLFAADTICSELVTHECVHAACWLYVRHRGRKFTESLEEAISRAAGKLAGEFLEKFQRAGGKLNSGSHRPRKAPARGCRKILG